MIKNIKILIVSTLIIFSCQDNQKANEIEKKKLILNTEQLKAIDATLIKIEMMSLQPVIYATGKLELLQNSKASLSSNIVGKIERFLVKEGEKVHSGQPIIELSSIDLIELQQEYLNNKNELIFMEKEYERQKTLMENNVGALADFQRTESNYKRYQNKQEAISEKLKLLGVSIDKLNQDKADIVNKVNIITPINGSVFKLKGYVGMAVDISTSLAEVIDLSKIYANIDVYEKDIDQISENQNVLIDFINQSTPYVDGKVKRILQSIDPESKSIPVHVEFEHIQNALLLPEMLVKVKILGNIPLKKSYVAPISAVLREGELLYVYNAIQVEGGYEFKKVKIETGETNGDLIEIFPKSPFVNNSQLVSKNVYLIDAETKKFD
jgi:cobalt-zinc-cadmium efflux system membrane fusion protein